MKHYGVFQCDNGNDYVSEGLYRIVDKRGRIGYADESGRTENTTIGKATNGITSTRKGIEVKKTDNNSLT